MKTTQVLMITVISAVLVIALVGPAAEDRVVGPGSVTTPAFMADGSNGSVVNLCLQRWGHAWAAGGAPAGSVALWNPRVILRGIGWSSTAPIMGLQTVPELVASTAPGTGTGTPVTGTDLTVPNRS